MTPLDQLIATAFQNQGKIEDVNKVYLTFLNTSLFIPTKKEHDLNDEPFSPLYAFIENQYYLLAFDTLERLRSWAKDEIDQIAYVEISGHALILGINNQVYLCLNVGSALYKEFS